MKQLCSTWNTSTGKRLQYQRSWNIWQCPASIVPIILMLYTIAYWHDHCKWSIGMGLASVVRLDRWLSSCNAQYNQGTRTCLPACRLSPVACRVHYNPETRDYCYQSMHNIRRGNPLFRRRRINFIIPQRTPLNFQPAYVAHLKPINPTPQFQNKNPISTPSKTPVKDLFTTNPIPLPPLFYTPVKTQKPWRIL